MMIPKQKQVGCDNVISFFLEFELLKALTHFKRHFKIFTHAATISAAIFSKALFGSQHRLSEFLEKVFELSAEVCSLQKTVCIIFI